MSFDYQSMDRKYEVLTGNQISDMPGSYRYNFSEIRKLPCVRLSQIDAGSLKLNDVRDWCEENFGDNWIYEWDKFYFKNPKDATVFALRWYS